MIYFILALIIISAVISVLLLAPLKIGIEYRNSKMKINVKCLFVRFIIDTSDFKNKKRPKASAPAEQKAESSGVLEKIKNLKNGYDNMKGVLDEVLGLLKDKAEFSGIYIRVKYGTGDAAITGIIYGAIWSLVGSVYALLCRYFRIRFPELELEPVFGGKVFEIEAEGIITTRLVHIITASIRSGKNILKSKKERI